MDYHLLKFAHVLGAIVLMGTGTGIAFFMFMAHRSQDPHFVAETARVVVIADIIFTATAVILQPLTGYFLVEATGRSLTDRWILISLALYIGAGVFWLPVVWIQTRFAIWHARRGSRHASPDLYHRLFRIWFAFGIPALGLRSPPLADDREAR